MDAAPEVGLQHRTGTTGRLVDGEVRRSREGRCGAAQARAAAAVRAQVSALIDHSQRHRGDLAREYDTKRRKTTRKA
jgi:hypothetical protein